MALHLMFDIGPVHLAFTVGDKWWGAATDDSDDEETESVDESVIAELLRLGAETQIFGFSSDPAFRDKTGWEDEE